MAEKLKSIKFKIQKRVLFILDILIALFVVTPPVVALFRALWVIQDLHPVMFHPVFCLFAGSFLHIIFALTRDNLNSLVQNKKPTLRNTILSYILRKLYSYLFGWACVLQFRGGWIIVENICENNLVYIVMCTVVSCAFLILLKSVRNVNAPPFVIAMDSEDVVFNFPTRFNTSKSSDRICLYVLDCFFSVFVVGSLVVFVWRGAWVLFDIYLFPEDFVRSSWISLVLGYAMVAMAFSMQPAMRWLCDRITGFTRILAADTFLLFSVLGTINVWRGIWNLLEIYYLPDYPEISCWTCHWFSLLLLILLNCSNSLLVRGVYIDAEEPAGRCVIFPIYYLRLIFKNERQKKHVKNIQLEVMAKRKHEIDCLKPKNENCTCSSEQNHVLLQQNHVEV